MVGYDIPGQYVVSLRLVLPVPLAAEPRELEGVATIMARTMDEGTRRHGPEELAELLERKGVGFGASVGEAGITVEVDVAKGRLPDALGLLAEIVGEPAFPGNEVERQVKTRLAEIERERAAPAQRAGMEFVSTYFDRSERSARPAGGTPATVSAITADAVRSFHERVVGPQGATLVVAGDLGGADVAAQAASALAGWTSGPRTAAQAEADRPAARADDAERIVFVDRPGSVQTELYLGCPGPDRRTPGWAAYPLLAFVLGGAPTSRIDAVLREEKGFTYGIRSVFRPRRRGGLFLTSGSVRADVTAEALGLVLDILGRAVDGFGEEEVRSGADYLRMTAPARFATADAVADEAAMLCLDGLTTQFTTDTLAALGRLTAAELSEAYRRYVTGRWTVVLVGDATRHADAVARLGRGPVTVVPA